jgi:hypothetical protein
MTPHHAGPWKVRVLLTLTLRLTASSIAERLDERRQAQQANPHLATARPDLERWDVALGSFIDCDMNGTRSRGVD